MSVLSVKTNINMEKRKMPDVTKLLIRLFDNCNHPSVLFFEQDCTFRCMKCNEKLVKCASIDEFRLFCELSGKDPKSLLA